MPDALPNPRPVAPADPASPRPRWSVMLPVCDRMTFFEQMLRSVLGQDPGRQEMQIELIDNSTTDADFPAVIRAMAGDRVSYFRQPRHLPMAANWNTAIDRSRGQLVHILHDDDYVAPDFYGEMGGLADRFPEAAILVSRCFAVDQDGTLEWVTKRLKWLETGSRDPAPNFWPNLIYCPGVVVRRSQFEAIGGFDESLGAPADYEMWMRAIVTGGGAALSVPLAYYREHRANLTGEGNLTGRFWQELWRVGCRVATYAPRIDVRTLRRSIERVTTDATLRFDREGNRTAAKANFRVFWEVSQLRGRLIWLLRRVTDGEWSQLVRELGYLTGGGSR